MGTYMDTGVFVAVIRYPHCLTSTLAIDDE